MFLLIVYSFIFIYEKREIVKKKVLRDTRYELLSRGAEFRLLGP